MCVKMKKSIFISMIVLLLIAMSAVCASDDLDCNITESNDIEINSEDILSASHARTFSDLQGQIKKAKPGSTITLTDDYEYREGVDRLYGVVIYNTTKDITIDGNGHTLNGKNTTRILFVFEGSTNITVKNLNFINGYEGNGAGTVCWKGEFGTITNCNFTSNSADKSGGAVLWAGANGTISNNKFERCTSNQQSGGALYCNEKSMQTTITNNLFIHNVAKTCGGGMVSCGANTIISNNIFQENGAGESGAAIYTYGINSKITDNQFIKNQANGSAGAIYIETSGIIMDRCIFKDNFAPSGGGGAMRWNGNDGTMTNCVFKSNTATVRGGAIFWNGNNAHIEKNNFTDNAANTAAGGALLYSGDNSIIISNNFEGNTDKGHGGAIYAQGNSNIITNNKFDKNEVANSGGAIYYDGSEGIITNNIIIQNTAKNACGIRWNGAGATITGNIFKGNKNTNPGNIIYGDGAKATVSKNTFLNSKESDKCIRWNSADARISGNIYKEDTESKLTCENTKIYYGESKLVFTLTIIALTPLSNKKISLSLNKNNYEGITDLKGKVTFNIKNLEFGTYTATAIFSGDGYYEATQTTLSVTSKSTILSKDLTAEVGNVKYNATFLDSKGKELSKGKYVSFTVENNVYKTQIENKGVATAIIDKEVGDYTIIIKNTVTGETATKKLKITKANPNLKVSAKDIKEGKNAVFDITTEVKATGNVTLNINNVTYRESLENGKVKITVSNLTAGKYPYMVKYEGNDKYREQSISSSLNVKSGFIEISAPDVSKFYGGPERLAIKVIDKSGYGLNDIPITIIINGVAYNRTTREDGTTSIGLNLPKGNYTADIIFKGDSDYSPFNTTSNVNIKTTIIGFDVVKIEKSPEPYVATFLDSTGKYLPQGEYMRFNINGVFYDRVIRENGQAKLNLNLEAKTYIITAYNTKTGEESSNTITIKPRIVNNSNVIKYFKNDTQYEVTILDDNGNPVKAGEVVTFNINGVFYERKTNENGTAKLNINLEPKTYIITTEYKNCRAANTIKVLPVLSAKDLTMKYRDGSQFKATLVDGQGKAYYNQTVIFNVNGVFYFRQTDINGTARLNINLMAGKYIITSSYNGSNIANTITINL